MEPKTRPEDFGFQNLTEEDILNNVLELLWKHGRDDAGRAFQLGYYFGAKKGDSRMVFDMIANFVNNELLESK